MTTLRLMVNDQPRTAEVEPRTHLADVLREHLLLTGTHLGCEHGVCGACTLLIDGAPARSCITLAALCEGSTIHSIEGLADDPVMTALRAAFTAEHALQCGYCTPGMLITARDIVMRLPDADDDRIRLELAGNLCRCTGYNGIVKAIRRVLDQQIAAPMPAPAKVAVAAPIIVAVPVSAPRQVAPGGAGLSQTLRIAAPADTVWAAIQNPEFVAGCVPGAKLTRIDGTALEGEMRASLGPIQAVFTGAATLTFNATGRSGTISGEGRDRTSGTRLSADVTFTVEPDGAGATQIQLDIAYALRGALAQFSRGPIVTVFAAEIASTVARTLEARLQGAEPPAEQKLNAFTLALRVIWQQIRRLFRA